MIRRGSSGLAFWFPSAVGISGVGATRERPDAALISGALGPPFGNQNIRIASG